MVFLLLATGNKPHTARLIRAAPVKDGPVASLNFPAAQSVFIETVVAAAVYLFLPGRKKLDAALAVFAESQVFTVRWAFVIPGR